VTVPKRALVVHGGWWGHKPHELAERYGEELTDLGFEVESSDTLEALDAVAGVDLVLPIWTTGELSADQERHLVAAVKAGCGVVGFHSATDAFRSNTDYQFMIGGQFVWHPPGRVTFDVRFGGEVPEESRGLIGGLENFTVTAEQYHVHVDPVVDVLATTAIVRADAGGVPVEMPVAWARHLGLGRVFYCSLGHDPAEHEIPQFRELMRRALRWAARSDGASTMSGP